MPPVVWNFQDKTLVVKFVGNYTNDQLFGAFAEALMSAEYKTCATLLIDSRSSLMHASPEVLHERVKFIFDSVKGQISRIAVVRTPQHMATPVGSAMELYRGFGMDARAFTDIEDAFAWLEAAA